MLAGLNIGNNLKLRSIGLPNLIEIGESVAAFHKNPLLKNLALPALETTTGTLKVFDNAELESIRLAHLIYYF